MRVSVFTALFVAGLFCEEGVAQSSGLDVPTEIEGSETVDFSACHAIQNPISRLGCYDSATAYTPPSPQETESGGWVFVERADQFTNRNVSYVFLPSDQSGIARTDAPDQLVVRCDGEGGAEIFVTTGGYIGARNDQVPVRYRFGDRPPISERWNESTNGTSAFLPRSFRDFRRELDTRENFVFEVTDYRGSRSSARFEGLRRNEDRLVYVLNGCN